MPPHLFSPEQFLQLADAEGSPFATAELLNGTIHSRRAETMAHDSTAHLVWETLVQKRPELQFHRTSRVRLGNNIVIPDLAGFDPDQITADDHGFGPQGLELVVEVVGKTTNEDLGVKLNVYAIAQIPEYWAIQPEHGFVQRFTRPAEVERGFYRDMLRLDFADVLV